MGNEQTKKKFNLCNHKDSTGKTPLHNLLENLLMECSWFKMKQLNSEDESEFWNFLSQLITSKNVNAKDKEKVTPYSWILLWQELVTFVQPTYLMDIQNLTTKMAELDRLFKKAGASRKYALKTLPYLRYVHYFAA